MFRALSLSAAVLLTACAATPSADVATGLPVGNWATGDGLAVRIINGQMLGTTKCSRFASDVTMDGGRLISQQLRADSSACPPDALAGERLVFDFFQAGPAVQMPSRNQLVLGNDPQRQITLNRVKM